MNLDDLLLPSATGAVGAFVTWIFGKRKEDVEVKSSELDNTEKAVKLWREMAEELKKQVDDLNVKVDTLMQEVHSLRMENAELRQKIDANKRTRSKSDKEV